MWFLPFVECEGDKVILSLVLRLFKKSGKQVMVSHGAENYLFTSETRAFW